ncbi:hypothetical protein ABZ912_05380 [Nonomuraea angiospora]|uniref:hypothetical protein n=1 Tax=Nonomuraea angiospora TaxID=46172 RepID=UPI0033F3C80E
MIRITALGLAIVFAAAIIDLSTSGAHPAIVATLTALASVSIVATTALGRTRRLAGRAYQCGYFDATAYVSDDR